MMLYNPNVDLVNDNVYTKLKQCFLRKTMSPNHLPLSATLKIMVLSYGDHLSNNILWAEMVIGRNGYGSKWSRTKMVMARNNPEPLYMNRDMRKQTLCICENKDAKLISVFVFAKWIVQSLYFLNLKFQWSSSLL